MATLDNVEVELCQRTKGMLADEPSLWIESAYRSIPAQAKMYAKWMFGVGLYGRDGALKRGYVLAAPPGKSNHNKKPCKAVDVGALNSMVQRRKDLALKWGLHTPVPGEPWHMELDPNRGPAPMPEIQPKLKIQPKEDEELPRYADKYQWADGAQVQVFPDGAVKCFGAKFYGSIYNVKPEARTTFTRADAVRPVDVNDSQAGYIVCNENGDQYKFDAAFFSSV